MKVYSRKHLSIRRKCVAAVLAVMMLWMALPGAAAAETVTVRFMNDDYIWHSYELDFTDSVFGQDCGSYQPQLARMSIALAVSAFRDWEVPERKQHLGEDFLTSAGFTDIRSWDYEGDPTPDTIGLLVGRKAIGGRTVVAMAPSGEYYRQEWVSNLYMGDPDAENITRHEGFYRAAEKVFDRLTDYTRDIDGEWVLWGTGFSRAGAVANIAAALLLQQGILPADRVYVYAYAIPCHTVLSGEEQESGLYQGCWNLISPYDPIPDILPSSWGFVRYGHTVLLPDPDNSGQRDEAARGAKAWSSEHFGVKWYQDNLAPLFHDTLDSVVEEVIPTPKDYILQHQESLQEIMRSYYSISGMASEGNSNQTSSGSLGGSAVSIYRWFQMGTDFSVSTLVMDFLIESISKGHRPRNYISVVMGCDLVFGE